MEAHTPKFKVRLGLFITGGVILFLVALFIIGKQKNMFNPIFKLTTTFYNVSGLQVGSNILFSGIAVGTVDQIAFVNDSTVRVDMIVRKNVQQFIKSDCVAGIGSSGLIGDRILIISQGGSNSPIVTDGQSISSKEPLETDAIMESLNTSAGSAEIITKQLAEIMTKVNSGHGTLGRLIHDTEIAENLSESTVNLKNSSKQLSMILNDINNGKGTIGKLVQDPTIAQDIGETLVNIKNSSKGVEELLEAAKHNFLFRGYFRKNEPDERSSQKRLVAKSEHTTITEEPSSPSSNDLQMFAQGVPVELDTVIASLQVALANSETITKQLAEIMTNVNSGKGTLGMLIQDTVLAKVINQTLLNLKSSSKGLDDNMNAAKETYFLKGYFNRKKKAAEEKEAEDLKKLQDDQKILDKKNE